MVRALVLTLALVAGCVGPQEWRLAQVTDLTRPPVTPHEALVRALVVTQTEAFELERPSSDCCVVTGYAVRAWDVKPETTAMVPRGEQKPADIAWRLSWRAKPAGTNVSVPVDKIVWVRGAYQMRN